MPFLASPKEKGQMTLLCSLQSQQEGCQQHQQGNPQSNKDSKITNKKPRLKTNIYINIKHKLHLKNTLQLQR